MAPSRRMVGLIAVALAVGVIAVGCAGTNRQALPNDPRMIRDEIAELDNDIANHKEMLKGSKAELQVEDSAVLRETIHSLEMDLYELEARRVALEQRIREIEAEGVNVQDQ